MNYRLVISLVFVCSIYMIVVSEAAAADSVQVRVSVRTEDQLPVEGSLLRAIVDGRGSGTVDAVTDSRGIATLTVDVPLGSSFVEIRHGFATPSTIAEADHMRVSRTSTENTIRYSFDPFYCVSLVDEQQEYELNVTARAAISVTAKFVDHEQRPLQTGTLIGPPMSWPGGWERGQSKPLRGLRRGVESIIAAVARVGDYLMVKRIHLDRDRTTTDVNLGTVAFDAPPAGVAIRTKLSGDQALRSAGKPIGPIRGMTVVSVDGQLIATFRAGPSGTPGGGGDTLELLTSDQWTPVLPPGEYVVIPGYFLYHDAQSVVLKLLAIGVDLAESELPRITVRDGAANDDVVDLVHCYDAIMQLAAREGVEQRSCARK